MLTPQGDGLGERRVGCTKEWNIDWTGIPRTDRKATTRSVAVGNAHVVFIERGSIRSAKFENAHFLVAGETLRWTKKQGKPRVEVQCLWHGRKPHKTWMHVAYEVEPVEKPNYSGEVVSDFR